MRERPEIIAHRGFSASAPENTLAAFEAAVAAGADRIELDVQLTRNGAPVILHDDLLDRTTSGKGPVEAMSLDEIRRLDAGSWFHPRFRRERVPTLDEALDCCAGRIAVNVEIKACPGAAASGRIERLVAEAVAARRPPGAWTDEWAIVSSFDRGALERLRRIDPRIPIELLHDAGPPGGDGRPPEPPDEAALDSARSLGAAGLNVSLDEIRARPELAAMAHSRSLRIKVYTVDLPGDMERLAALGVDGIFTNRPDVLARELGRGGRSLRG